MPYTPLGLDHIMLRVRDQAAAQKFYIEMLGCTLDFVNEKISLVQLRFGEHMIDLFPGGGATPDSSNEGIDHYCLSIGCDDIAAMPRTSSSMRRCVNFRGYLSGGGW